MSRKCKHITVSVSQEQYYRARLLAAEYDTTVTSMVAFLLEKMPSLLRRTNYPKPNSDTHPPPVASEKPESESSKPPASLN